jgi:hypothetical protein
VPARGQVGQPRDFKGLAVGVKGLVRASGGDIWAKMKGLRSGVRRVRLSAPVPG